MLIQQSIKPSTSIQTQKLKVQHLYWNQGLNNLLKLPIESNHYVLHDPKANH